jgi:DNA invertase Pin-like site-specific DNA recombinase
VVVVLGVQLTVVGYVRVSTDEQLDSGAGLEAQRRTIRAECQRRGWRLFDIYEDAASGRAITGRSGLKAALTVLDGRVATALVVAKLDRLSRSLLDFAALMERGRLAGWALVALDLGVDTTTPSGEMMANVLAVFAQFERRLIGQRTREALSVKRHQGVRLGRPPVLSRDLVANIRRQRTRGASLAAIAARLNANAIPTAHGGHRWHVSTVRALLLSRSSSPVALGTLASRSRSGSNALPVLPDSKT